MDSSFRLPDINRQIDLFKYEVDTVNNEVETNNAIMKSTDDMIGGEMVYLQQLKPIDPEEIRTAAKLAGEIIAALPEELRDLDTIGQKLQDRSFTPTGIDRDHLEEFYSSCTTLFHTVIPSLEKSPFSKSAKMPKEVQNFLSPEIRAGREIKAKSPHLAHKTEHRTPRKIAKGQLAMKLGHGQKGSKGATGTMLLLDINGKYVGVYKVDTYDPNIQISTKMKSWFKASLGGQLSYLSQRKLAQPRAEVAADFLDKRLGLNLVPTSIEVKLLERGGLLREGVFQVFITRRKDQGALQDVLQAQRVVDNNSESHQPTQPSTTFSVGDPNWDETKYVEFKTIMDFWNQKTTFTEKEINLYQKFVIFDYLIGNLDRHEENWYVTLSKEGEITDIKAIDNANAFPTAHPNPGTIAAHNQYKWKELRISQTKFTKESDEFIKNNLRPDKVEEYLRAITEENPELSNFLEDSMKERFRERAQVLYLHALQGNCSPSIVADADPSSDPFDFGDDSPI